MASHASHLLTSPRNVVSQALQVPELLESIFSFLKEYNIRFVVSLVCRQWREVARLFINVTMKWYADVGDSSRQQGDDLSSFHRANTLICRQQFKGGTMDELMEFKDALSRRDPDDTVADQRAALLISALPELKNIRSLVLEMVGGNGGDPNRDTVLKWSNDIIKAAGPNLTSLTVDVLNDYMVPMAIIRKSCPRLQSLVVNCETVFGPMDPVYLGRIQEESGNQDSVASQPWSTMRSCELWYMKLDSEPLEDILRVCPGLKHLRIIGTQPRRTREGLQIDLATPDTYTFYQPDSVRLPFLRRLNGYCPNLETFHFSLNKRISQRVGFEVKMFEIFPKVRFWGMGLWEMKSPQSLDIIRTYMTENQLTTLDLFGNNLHERWQVRAKFKRHFHVFLCQSPHLIHLRAPGAIIHCDRLDPELFPPTYCNDRFPTPEARRDMNRPLLLWACRRLQTLHIQFDMNRGDNNRSWRLIYGYISRLCPYLQELNLNMARPQYGVLSGFSLLGRIHTLRRLTLYTQTRMAGAVTSPSGVADFGWMALEKPQFHDLNPERPQESTEDQDTSKPVLLISDQEEVEQGHQVVNSSGHATAYAEPQRSTGTSRAIREDQNQSQPVAEGSLSKAGVGRFVDIVSRLRGLVKKSSFRRRPSQKQERPVPEVDNLQSHDAAPGPKKRVILEGIDITDLGKVSDLDICYQSQELPPQNSTQSGMEYGVWPEMETIVIREWGDYPESKRRKELLKTVRPDVLVLFELAPYLYELY